MIAAIYARKSTEQNGVAEDAKSVTRQIEHARAYAARNGWTIAEDHIYSDDGISGAEFTKRPGFMRLMATLPRPPFGAVIMSEESRLGREMVQTMVALSALVTAGVRVFYYLEGKERTLNSPIEKAMMALETFGAEVEREKARQRTFDGMVRVAKAGRVTGGACFGYTNVRVVNDNGHPSHTERRINEAEAAVVRRIFQLCAEGKGVKAIARILNAECALSPKPQRGCPKGWASSSVRSVLHRRTYLGEIVYGQTRKRNKQGVKQCERRPEAEWVRTPQPAWRIVTDAQWDAAHQRLHTAAQTYARRNNGRLEGRPATGLEAKYLLSGIARCAICGASMIGHRSTRGKHQSYTYVCGGYSHRGPAVCWNRIGLPMPKADAAILEKLRDQVLDPEIVDGAVEDVLAAMQPTPDAAEAMRDALVRELGEVEHRQARLIDAIATAGDVAALAARLKDQEARRGQLTRELASFDQRHKSMRVDPRRIEGELRTRLADWRRLLGDHTPIARQMVLKLVDGRLVFTPKPEEGCYEFAGRTVLDKLLSGLIGPEMALPQVWRALQDSNLRPPGS